MKRNFVIFLLVLFLCFSAACTQNEGPGVSTDPTDTAPSQPSAEPNDIVTEAPTEDPTQAPAPTVLSFEDCSEERLLLVPYKSYTGPLPADAPAGSVLYLIDAADDGSGDIASLGTLLFAVDAETTVVCDGGVSLRGLYSYDLTGRLISHSEIALCGCRHAVLSNGILHTAEGAFDVETGSMLSAYGIPDNVIDENMQLIGSVPKMIFISESSGSEAYTLSYDYYELDSQSTWKKTESICKTIEDPDGEWTSITLANGTELIFEGCGYSVLGKDNGGNYYFTLLNNMRTVIKVSPDGSVLCTLEIPYTLEELWDPEMLLTLMEDGTLYIGVSLPDAFVIRSVGL